MGISDDIRPKAFKRLAKQSSKSAKKVREKKAEITHDLFTKPNDDDFFADTPIEKNGKNRKDASADNKQVSNHQASHNYHWLYTLIIVFVILILAGLVAWQNLDFIKKFINGSYKKQNDQNLSEIISSTNDSLKNYDTSQKDQAGQPTANQQSTAAPTIDKSAIKISVLNGSGIKSSAKTVADTLTAAGFTITSTGNARSFSYQTTYIYYKTGKEAEANLVKSAIADRAAEIKESNTIVGTKNDIVVVVGKT